MQREDSNPISAFFLNKTSVAEGEDYQRRDKVACWQDSEL